MRALNEAIDGAGRFGEFLDKIRRDESRQESREVDECPATGRFCEFGKHGPNGEMQCRWCGSPANSSARQPGENRAEHRARLKRERREAKKVRV